MPCALRVSEAASLALHAVGVLALEPDRARPVKSIASILDVSEAHLSKVLHRLTRQGLLRSARGPGGGFQLVESPATINLMQVFEAIEGPQSPDDCFLGNQLCDGRGCVLGKLLRDVNRMLSERLEETTLEEWSNSLCSEVLKAWPRPSAPR